MTKSAVDKKPPAETPNVVEVPTVPARRTTGPPRARMVDVPSKKGSETGVTVGIDIEGDASLAFGPVSDAVKSLLTTQLVNVLRTDQSTRDVDIGVVNQALDLMVAIGPKDGVEAMLAVQMVAAHQAAMTTARLALRDDQIPSGRQLYLSLSGKLMRTFTGQVEALNRGRGKGIIQRVVVERVNVEPGGQAVVGAVTTNGKGAGS
jgi:hypothetical protein